MLKKIKEKFFPTFRFIFIVLIGFGVFISLFANTFSVFYELLSIFAISTVGAALTSVIVIVGGLADDE